MIIKPCVAGLNHFLPISPSYKHLQEYCVLHKFTDCQAMLNAENIHIIIRNIALSSSCRQIIFPYQDILGLVMRQE